MEDVLNEAPVTEESQVEKVAAITETNIERMAREYFSRVFHISLVAVIEKKSNSPMANVTLFERGIGKRANTEIHTGDRLECGVEEFAMRFSNGKLQILWA